MPSTMLLNTLFNYWIYPFLLLFFDNRSHALTFDQATDLAQKTLMIESHVGTARDIELALTKAGNLFSRAVNYTRKPQTLKEIALNLLR